MYKLSCTVSKWASEPTCHVYISNVHLGNLVKPIYCNVLKMEWGYSVFQSQFHAEKKWWAKARTSICVFSRCACAIGCSAHKWQQTHKWSMSDNLSHGYMGKTIFSNVWFLLYNYLTSPVAELEVSGGESLADTLGVTVGVPGCRWLNLGEACLRFGVLLTGASAIGSD